VVESGVGRGGGDAELAGRRVEADGTPEVGIGVARAFPREEGRIASRAIPPWRSAIFRFTSSISAARSCMRAA